MIYLSLCSIQMRFSVFFVYDSIQLVFSRFFVYDDTQLVRICSNSFVFTGI